MIDSSSTNGTSDDNDDDDDDSVQFVSPYLDKSKAVSGRKMKNVEPSQQLLARHATKQKDSSVHAVGSKQSRGAGEVVRNVVEMQTDSSIIALSGSSDDDEEEDVVIVNPEDFGFKRK